MPYVNLTFRPQRLLSYKKNKSHKKTRNPSIITHVMKTNHLHLYL